MKKPTRRQTEIMPLVCEGYATKEIATMLHLSENTIKRHRMILMKKYKAKNSAHLVALWKDQTKLLPHPDCDSSCYQICSKGGSIEPECNNMI